MAEQPAGRRQQIRRALRVGGIVLLMLAVALGAFLGYLATSSPQPRDASPGWVRLRDMPHSRGEVGSAVVTAVRNGPNICAKPPCPEQLLYVVGGLRGTAAKAVDLVDVYDPEGDVWSIGPRLPEPRHHPAAASLNGFLYASGGAVDPARWTPERNFWVLGPGRGNWERLLDMPQGRMGHAMVTVGEKLYVVGGRGGARVEIFDPATGWKLGAAMPHPRDHLAAVAVGNRIYAIGGRDAKILDRVDVYDTVTDAWSAGPKMPKPASAMVAALLADGKIHVVGGENPGTLGGAVIDRHIVLNPTSGAWLPSTAPLLAVHGAASGVTGGFMVSAGGARRQGALSVLAWTGVTQRFDPRGAG
jgi:Kelch motif protein